MTTTGLIQSIQSMNPTARGEDLEIFDEGTLRAYHTRLMRTNEPRGKCSHWSRTSKDPAITAYVPTGV